MADSCDEPDENYSNVDLGFAESCEDKIYLTSLFFPSKLGGSPAWLRWDCLPSADTLRCGNCEKQLVLLCQIYVPLELPVDVDSNNDGSTESRPRTIYAFCCRNGPCSKYSSFIKAFRTERPSANNDEDLYEKNKNMLKEMYKKLENQYSLCSLCGCLGEKTCSSCHKVKYCSKEHQAMDWKYRHKRKCNDEHNSNSATSDSEYLQKHPLLFDEFEIVIEGEPAKPAKKESAKNDIDYTNSIKPIDPQLEKDLIKLDEQKADEYFSNFRERIDREPEQIIRYDLGGQPLWVSDENIPTDSEIPNCVCGAERRFEFQVLPQMINYLGVETTIDSIDWGTLCIYTCSKNCQDGHTYKEEFVWKQDFSQSDVVT